MAKLSTIGSMNIKSSQNIDKIKLKKGTLPVLRTRRNSYRRKSQSKLSHEDDNSWSFESSYDDEQRNSYESQSSHTSEYEISEHLSEQSSDTGVEVLSLNSQNTPVNDAIIYSIDDNNKVQTFSDTVSSTSSLNSEEGYYSNHDTSLSTLIDENQADVTRVPIFKKKSPVSKRTFSFPEIKNQTNFKLLKIKEENKQLAKAEIEIYNSTCSLLESNESPQMTVKYLSSVFNNCGKNLNKNLSSYTINNLMINDDEQINGENEFVGDVQENFRPRSFSAFQINSLSDVEKKKPFNSRFNAIKRIGNNAFKVEKIVETENQKDEFLLRDVFGSRLLVEAEHLFEPKFTLIRDLIKKFESKN